MRTILAILLLVGCTKTEPTLPKVKPDQVITWEVFNGKAYSKNQQPYKLPYNQTIEWSVIPDANKTAVLQLYIDGNISNVLIAEYPKTLSYTNK